MNMITRREFQVTGASLLALLLTDRAARAAAIDKLEDVAVAGMNCKLARPAGDIHGGIILIHEWWGLNEQMQSVAAALAEEGYLTLAVDLFGRVATSVEEAKANTQSVDAAKAVTQLQAAKDMLAKETSKIATMGFCFGGGWSLEASLAMPVDATVIYYGRCNKSADELAALKGPILGHFGNLDKFINTDMVDGFEKAMAEAGKQAEIYRYDADHAFANPTTARYEEGAAKLSYERTLAFLKANLQG